QWRRRARADLISIPVQRLRLPAASVPMLSLPERDADAASRYCFNATLIASAVRSASAAMVRVGFAVPEVGNSDAPANHRLGWSWLWPAAVATDVLASVPILVVPMMWPAPSA